MENKLVVFKNKEIRRTLHNNEWWFSVIDVCGALTGSRDSGAYWRKLKQRLKAEGSGVVTNCHGLKLVAPDGKNRVTDCANIAGDARGNLELESGREVVSSENYLTEPESRKRLKR